MAIQGASQALIAAFTFGIVVNAASAALFLFTRGHGSSIFRDGLRLVLITFLLTSALWAQIDFITTVIDTTGGTMSCQIGLIFSTLFDQVGRFAMEQYLLWAMVTPGKTSAGGMVTQVFIAARFIVGAVFIGFTRPQVDTFCVARSSLMPVAFTVIALDGVIIVCLAARALMTGLVADVREGKSSSSRSKSILIVMVGFVIWTAMSIPMMLGMTTVDLIFRTALPAIGLVILIIIVTACSGELASPRGSQSSPPEAPSPRRINISRDISTADSSDYPPSRFEDLKDEAIRSSTAFLQPREAPTAFGETGRLPNIARPVTGIAGIGGLPIQGALFPPTRVETMPAPDLTRKTSTATLKQKRGLFGIGNGASHETGKMTIGNPILMDNDAQNPLNKIATIDLREAARAEHDRRAMALKQESDFVGRRPAPQPPNMTPQEAVKRSISVKRKEVASVTSPPAVPSSTLQPVNMSLTTSAQLSPGVEEIRRRSPRFLPADHQEPPVSQRSPFVTSPVQMRAVTPPQVVEKPLEQSPQRPVTARAGIRPSRKLSSPKKEPIPEPTKTPLQRRPTTGLPPGPRARKLNLAKEADAQAQQTVMFVNNIVYDDPNEVQRIIDGASDRASKAAPRQPQTPDDSASVVHRPRPIPRKPEHRRSRSGGSLVSRKSILDATAGSPTQLPPLPPPPKSAGMPSRPHPNDTKSMTVDEKMGAFFASPPRDNMRKGFVPEIPPVPRPFMDTNSSPTEDVSQRRSNRTTKTSVQTDNLFEVDELPSKPVNKSRFSPETNFADEVGRSWLPGITDVNRQTQSTQASSRSGAGKRGSSPVLPLRESGWTDTTESRTRDTRDDSTNWDSQYSPGVAVGVQVARATSIKRVNSRNVQSQRPPSERSSGEVINFMLDATVFDGGLRANEPWMSGEDSMTRPERASQWHRRVGDNCPSFSERKEKTRSRKMPPPTPLLLNAGSNKNAMIIHTAEPSPIESPEHAIQQIQEQLKKFEQPNRDSVESTGKRLALLENLEKEMGMQENHWHEMQHDLGRNSMSSVGTTNSNRNSRRESVIAAPVPVQREAPPPPKPNLAQERRALRRSRIRSGSTTKPDEPSQLQVPANSRAGAWQQKLALAEAEMEYMDNATDASKLRGFNFLTVSKAQLGSPTPPDSEQSESDEEFPAPPVQPVQLDAAVARASRGQPQRNALWVPDNTTPAHRSSGLLWSPPHTRQLQNASPQLPGLTVRPAQRKETSSLTITSSQLWRKPHPKNRSTTGLWRPSWASAPQPAPAPAVERTTSRPVSSQSQSQPQSQKPPRPLTQRPPRRNRRVTLLPDIVEDPQPLPDKRGTLGIFQFPWGERSDTASVSAYPVIPRSSNMMMAMPGTMTSGGGQQSAISAALQARARELESAEYSSSFFDEYDEETDGMDVSAEEEDDEDEYEEDSGDDFDETTLWEIASLLKSDSIPSKNSLFPPPLMNVGDVVEDYMHDIPSDYEGEEEDDEIVIGLMEEEEEKPRVEASVLWTGGPMAPGRGEHEPESTRPTTSRGLFKLDPRRSDYRTTSAEPAAKNMSRKPRHAEHKPLDRLVSAGMWTKTGNSKARFQQMSHGMWSPPRVHQHVEFNGLFTVNHARTDYRTTSAPPAAKDMARKPRVAEYKPLEKLASTSLWSAKPHVSKDRNWITASSSKFTRPTTTKADWSAALTSAVKASYPSSRTYPHRNATPEDWSSALDKALSLSYPLPSHAVFPEPSPSPPATFDPLLAEQIRQLEEEKMFVARMAGQMYQQRVLPEEEEEVVIETSDEVEVVLVQERDRSAALAEEKAEQIGREKELREAEERAQQARREEEEKMARRREKEERKAQILAQIKAIEEGAELDGFAGRVKREEADEGVNRKSTGVVLRY
ncbi:hypothetical protein GE09DRAFT_958614 [Coniochaeta sp. 2T2.1]|nr:hypothetical protein GE09DRAFT_958614 [Coniochaeta sp. 2T2.1]